MSASTISLADDQILARTASAADVALAAAGIHGSAAAGAEVTVTLFAQRLGRLDATIRKGESGAWFLKAAEIPDSEAHERGDIIFLPSGYSIDIGNLSIAAAA